MLSHSSTYAPKRLACLSILLLTLLGGAGCVGHRHSIGLGATGTGEQMARQYYIMFGLISANDVNAQRMAGGLTSYEIETSYSFFDMILAPFLVPLTMTTRTVTVRT